MKYMTILAIYLMLINFDDFFVASSTPSLNKDSFEKTIRSWTSTSNLTSKAADNNVIEVTAPLRIRQRPSSWSSTPDLENAQKSRQPESSSDEIVVSVQIPVRRRNTANLDVVEESFTLKRSSQPPLPSHSNATLPPQPKLTLTTIPQKTVEKDEEVIIINKTDSLAERVRKMQLIKRQGSLEREIISSKETSPNERLV